MGKLNSQILKVPRCFGPHHLILRGSMGDFKVFFGPFSQLQTFRPVLGIPGGCNFENKLKSQKRIIKDDLSFVKLQPKPKAKARS